MSERKGSPSLKASAMVLVVVAVVIASWPVAEMIGGHATDFGWPDHARFHVTWSAAQLIALAAISAFVGLFPLRKGRKWAWIVEFIIVVVGYGAAIPARLWHGSGPPIPVAVVLVALPLVALAAGIAPVFGDSGRDG